MAPSAVHHPRSASGGPDYLSPVYGWVLLLGVVASWYGTYWFAYVLRENPGPGLFVYAFVPFAFLLILLEQCLIMLSGYKGAGQYSATEFFTSISAGFSDRLVGIHMLPLCVSIISYTSVWDRFRILDLSTSFPFDGRPWAYQLFVFLLADYSYYWLHRFLHTIGFLWAGHRVHHQAERYNFAAALRQSYVQGLFSAFFYIPIALFVAPPLFALHRSCNTIYQFWVHTCLIRRLPYPFELILSTPSHHRVHHDRRVHKNHGGVLILWDRLHGTFLDEDDRGAAARTLASAAARQGCAAKSADDDDSSPVSVSDFEVLKSPKSASLTSTKGEKQVSAKASEAKGSWWAAPSMESAPPSSPYDTTKRRRIDQDEDELFGVFHAPTSHVDAVTQFSGIIAWASQRVTSPLDYWRGPGWHATVARRSIVPASVVLKGAGIEDDLSGAAPNRPIKLVDRYRLYSPTLQGKVGSFYLYASYLSVVAFGFLVLVEPKAGVDLQAVVLAHLLVHGALLDGFFGRFSSLVETLRCVGVIVLALPHLTRIFIPSADWAADHLSTPLGYNSTEYAGRGGGGEVGVLAGAPPLVGGETPRFVSVALGGYVAATAVLAVVNLAGRPFGGTGACPTQG